MRTYIIFFIIAGVLSCTYDTITIVPECEENLVLEINEKLDADCNSSNGSFSILVTNPGAEAQPFTYSISNVNQNSSGNFENLSAGLYTVSVTDGICSASINVQIENKEGLNASFIAEPTSCGGQSGSIELSVSNASGLPRFRLNGGTEQSSPSFTGLAAGNYEVEISDDSNCNLTLQVSIGNDTEYAMIESIINSSCAISGCHAGNVFPDFRVKSNILDRANRILARTSAGTMPPASSSATIESSEIDLIECWVSNGAPG